MTTRREFIKSSGMIGTVAAFSSLTKNQASGSVDAGNHESFDTYTISVKQAEKYAVPARTISIPDVEGFKVLKGDFHIHTLFSDGRVMPEARVNEAVDNGLDVISITDHFEYRPFFGGPKAKWKLQGDLNDNHNIAYEVAKPIADKKGLLLVRGAEITKKMPPGHFNTLFLQDANPIAAVIDDWRQMIRVAVEQGAFIQWNHPGWESQIGRNGIVKFLPEHEEIHEQGRLHGIEIYGYGPDLYPVVADWCNKKDLAILANSDIHLTELEFFGRQNPLRPITLILARERTVESVREAFFAKRTVAWASGLLWGRKPWLPALFKASVEVRELTPGKYQLTNRSSLPCMVSAGGAVFELSTEVPRQVYRHKTENLTVHNWMTGMSEYLEIPFKEIATKQPDTTKK